MLERAAQERAQQDQAMMEKLAAERAQQEKILAEQQAQVTHPRTSSLPPGLPLFRYTQMSALDVPQTSLDLFLVSFRPQGFSTLPVHDQTLLSDYDAVGERTTKDYDSRTNCSREESCFREGRSR